MKNIASISIVVMLLTAAAPALAATPVTVVGDAAAQLLSTLVSVGAPSRRASGDTNTVTTADKVSCGPVAQGATCTISFDDEERSIERAGNLARLLSSFGATSSAEVYNVTDLFCRSFDDARGVVCSFNP